MTRFRKLSLAAFALAAATGMAATVTAPAHARQGPNSAAGSSRCTALNPCPPQNSSAPWNQIKQTVCVNNPAGCATTPTPTQGGSPTPDCATVAGGNCINGKLPDERSDAIYNPNVKPTFSRLH